MQLTEKIEFLRKSQIYSTLNQAELTELSKISGERKLKPNEFLIREGEHCDLFYILVEGRLRMFSYSSLGKEFLRERD